jgi:hypothetical protein
MSLFLLIVSGSFDPKIEIIHFSKYQFRISNCMVIQFIHCFLFYYLPSLGVDNTHLFDIGRQFCFKTSDQSSSGTIQKPFTRTYTAKKNTRKHFQNIFLVVI